MSTDESNKRETDAKKISEPESIIQFFLDQFKIKTTVLDYINEKTSLRLSSRFFDALILLIFLLLVFWETRILTPEISSATVILTVIALAALTEFLGANTTVFKKFISKDEKSKIFLQNISFMTHKEMIRFLNFNIFSPKCINFLLVKVKNDTNQIPPGIVEYILTTQDLTKGNLDLLFSRDVMENLRESIIVRVLYKKQNALTQQNIVNVYECFKGNNKVIQMLVATQYDIQGLLGNYKDDVKLADYFDSFQVRQKHLDFWLRYCPVSDWLMIRGIIFVVSLPCFIALMILICISNPSLIPGDPSALFALLFGVPCILVTLLGAGLKSLNNRVMKRRFEHFIYNLESGDQSIQLSMESEYSASG